MTRATAPSTSPPPAAEPSPPAAAAIPPVRRWHRAALAAILLLAALLRLHDLTLNSLWIDEIYSVETSASQRSVDEWIPRGQIVDHPPHATRLENAPPAWRIWTTMDGDPHPPLYFVLLRLWRDAFGSSVAAMRSLALLASVAGIAILFDLGRHTFGPVPALWACLIMALAQQQIWYAQEVRGYALEVTLLLGACAAVMRIERRGFNAWRAASLGVCLVAAMLTHYFAVAGCAAVGAYALIRLRGRSRRQALAVFAAAAAVYAVIWGPFFFRQTQGVAFHDTWALDPGAGFFWRWGARLLEAPMRLLAQPQSKSIVTSWFMWLVFLLPIAFLRRRPALLFPLLFALAVIALPAGMDLRRGMSQLGHERYFLAAGPAMYLLAAGLLSDRRPLFVRHALPAAIAAYCALSLPWTYIVHKADWRDVGRHANAVVRDGDVVAFYCPINGDRYAGIAYLAVDHFAPDVSPRVLLLDGKPVAPDVLAQLRTAPAAWLFSDVADPGVSTLLPGFTIRESHLGVAAGYFSRLVPTTPASGEGKP